MTEYMNEKQITKLHAQQKANMISVMTLAVAMDKRNKAFQQAVLRGMTQEQQQEHHELNHAEKAKAKTLLDVLSRTASELQVVRPFWTKQGYLTSTRTTPKANSSDTIIGKEMTALLADLLDETTRLRIGQELSKTTDRGLTEQAETAVANDNYPILSLCRLEAEYRVRNGNRQAKDILNTINSAINNLNIPEQVQVLAMIDEAIEMLDKARQTFYAMVGGGAIHTRAVEA
jgi:hypothetical protein